MDDTLCINPGDAQALLAKVEVLTPDEVVKLLRFLKRGNDDLAGKLRQLKSEMGRVARR